MKKWTFIKLIPLAQNSRIFDILKDFDKKLAHLDQAQADELKMLILEYEHAFPDIPTRT